MKEGKADPKAGQALIEYILMLSAALLIVGLVNQGFYKIRNYLWRKITCEVAAPCPGCEAPAGTDRAVSRSFGRGCN
ncbi:MAG: hypothetical protein AB7P04_06130 [Bacteriovoracia bacterium]